jgi:hypothetical protein
MQRKSFVVGMLFGVILATVALTLPAHLIKPSRPAGVPSRPAANRSMGVVVTPHDVGPTARNRPLPKGWVEQEFNGLKYYVVPLAEKG